LNNLYICSFMGCGKENSRELSKQLKWRFVDLEQLIENIKKRDSRKEVFDKVLEPKYEKQALKLASKMKNVIVFVGDKTFETEENILIAKESGAILYLYYSFRECYKKLLTKSRSKSGKLKARDELEADYRKQHTLLKIASNHMLDMDDCPKACRTKLARRFLQA